jgi:hypothetical protein
MAIRLGDPSESQPKGHSAPRSSPPRSVPPGKVCVFVMLLPYQNPLTI